MKLSSRLNKVILLLHTTLYSVAESMVWTVEIIYLYDLGFSYTIIFLIYTFSTLATFLFTWRWGILIDRRGDSRLFLILGSLAFSAVPLAYLTIRNPYVLLAVSFISSAITVARNPAVNAEATLLSKDRASSVGDIYTGISVGWTLGSLIDTLILSYINKYSVIFIIATTFSIISSPLVIFYRSKVNKGTKRGRRKLPKSFIYFGMLWLGTGMFYNVFAIIFYSIMESRALYSLAVFLASITSIVTSPLYGRLADKIDRRVFLSIITAMRSIYMLSLIIVTNKLALLVLYSIPLWNAVMIPLISIAGEEYGGGEAEAQGVLNSILSLAYFIGGATAGILSDFFLKGELYLAASLGIFICFISTALIITHFAMMRKTYSNTALK